MVMLNDLDRFHLVIDVIDRVPGLAAQRRAPAPGDGRPPPRGAGLDARARRGRARDPRLDLAALSRSPGRILVVNAGSTSLKLSLVDEDERTTPVDDFVPADAVGHRIVHLGRLVVEAAADRRRAAGGTSRRAPRSRRCTTGRRWRRSSARARRCRTSRTSRSPTRTSTARCRTRRDGTRFPRTGGPGTASCATASTGSPSRGSPSRCGSRGSSSATSAAAARSPPSPTAARSTRRWA